MYFHSYVDTEYHEQNNTIVCNYMNKKLFICNFLLILNFFITSFIFVEFKDL